MQSHVLFLIFRPSFFTILKKSYSMIMSFFTILKKSYSMIMGVFFFFFFQTTFANLWRQKKSLDQITIKPLTWLKITHVYSEKCAGASRSSYFLNYFFHKWVGDVLCCVVLSQESFPNSTAYNTISNFQLLRVRSQPRTRIQWKFFETVKYRSFFPIIKRQVLKLPLKRKPAEQCKNEKQKANYWAFLPY